MKILIPAFLILFFLATGDLLGQIKYEKESRIKAEEVPLRARQFVDSLEFTRRVRWYSETSERGRSIEAKSKRDGKRFSAEFGLAGELQDVEVSWRWKELPELARRGICQSMKAEFERYRIIKVQRQSSGSRAEVLKYLTQGGDGSGLTTKYETVLKGRRKGETSKYEYTYSAEGKLEKRAKLAFRNTDNLEY